MSKKLLAIVLLFVILFAIPSPAYSQTYYFSVDKEIVNVFWEDDGTLSLDYVFIFTNSPSASPIDYVDVGFPNDHYKISNITADINGVPIADIDDSPYVDYGVALGLGEKSIQPGKQGRVHIFVSGITNVLFPDTSDNDYASGVFGPTWFGKEYVSGGTDMTVIFHLPPGVKPDEPRWHDAPSGFPSSPETALDKQGRITYTWHNPDANAYTPYEFGASFPKSYVPANAIVTPSLLERLGIDKDTLGHCACWSVSLAGIAFFVWLGAASSKKRKLKYLPPKLSIEGHGIKRGLTAVEAAILMEQPMDKVLTMILFSLLKKNAAKVISKDPLKIEAIEPQPAGLRIYEKEFLKAFKEKTSARRKKKLQTLMIALIKSVSKKMKGFSRKETIAYYKKIMEKAWQQIEAADTPEVKSQKFDEYMGWTMLDKDFDDHTKNVFQRGPVFVPIWWSRYDPGWQGTPVSSSRPISSGSGGSKSISMPTLPGSQFASSVVTGLQSFSSNVVGNITNFTSAITNKTNPVPKTSSGSYHSSGGGGCACACACAGCACACAGGGR